MTETPSSYTVTGRSGRVAASGVIFVLAALALLPSCSLNKMAVRMVADSLSGSGGSTVFTGDNDPELIGDALPFALKLYESLLEQVPEHEGLSLTTGSGYVMYANAFVAGPAGYYTTDRWEEQKAAYTRAKNLYLRGKDMLLASLDRKYPGFLTSLNAGDYTKAFAKLKKEDVPFLYWSAAGWVAAYSLDGFDLALGVQVSKAAALMAKAYELDPDFSNGTIDDFYIAFYGSMPEGLGGNKAKAREHFELALKKSGGKSAGPYVSLATSICIPEQNVTEFKELMNKALAVDPDAYPAGRLANILSLRKARWYTDHIDDFFLIVDDEEFPEGVDAE